MGLIDDEIKELRVMNQQLIDGSLGSKECLNRLKIYKATAERQKMILEVYRVNTLREIAVKCGLVGEEKDLLSPTFAPKKEIKKTSSSPLSQEIIKEEPDKSEQYGLGPRVDLNSIPGPTKIEKAMESKA